MWLRILMIPLFIGVGIAAVVGLMKGLDFQYDWRKCKSLDAKLSFSQFIKFFELHPKQWYLYDTHIERKNPNDYYSDIEVGFNSWLDFAKYRRWHKKYEEEKELASKAKAEQEQMGKLLKLIKADIKMVERQSQGEISSAQKIMEKVIGIDEDSADEKSSDTQAESGKRYFYYEGHQVMCGSTVYAIVDRRADLWGKPVREVRECVLRDIEPIIYNNNESLWLYLDLVNGDGEYDMLVCYSKDHDDDPPLVCRLPIGALGHRIFLTRDKADEALNLMVMNKECFMTEDGGYSYAGFTC